MANLVDTSVNGDLRVTGTMFGTQAGNYATCSTAGATAAKTATISGFTLTTGMHVYVKFSENNSAAVGSLTLNISGTGAKPIKCRGGNNLGMSGSIAANGIYEFAYDGTNWEMVGSAVTGVKGANESSYRWGNVNITAENVGAAASSHTHGNIANGGTLTDTAAAAAGNDYVVIRDADNAKIQTSTIKGTDVADAVSKKHSHSTLTLSTTAQVYDGSHTLALPSTDPYTSARTPTSHTHGNIANGGTLTDTAAAAAGNDYVVIRDADNAKIQTSTIKGTDVADAVSKKHSHSTLTLSTTAQAYDGTHTLALPSSDPYTSARTPSSHTHGNITNGGTITSDTTVASGDKIAIIDADNNKVARSGIAFDGSTTTTALTPKGTFETFSKLTIGTTSTTAAAGNHTHTTAIASDGSSGTVVTLAHNTQYKLTAGGTSVLFKTPADSNTDTKVTQTKDDSGTTAYPLLMAGAADPNGTATTARYDSGVKLTPSTNTISANISGNAASAGKLAFPRNIHVNLESNIGVNFDGSDNITPGVKGVLPQAFGGTGFNSADAAPTEGSNKMVVSGGVWNFSAPANLGTLMGADPDVRGEFDDFDRFIVLVTSSVRLRLSWLRKKSGRVIEFYNLNDYEIPINIVFEHSGEKALLHRRGAHTLTINSNGEGSNAQQLRSLSYKGYIKLYVNYNTETRYFEFYEISDFIHLTGSVTTSMIGNVGTTGQTNPDTGAEKDSRTGMIYHNDIVCNHASGYYAINLERLIVGQVYRFQFLTKTGYTYLYNNGTSSVTVYTGDSSFRIAPGWNANIQGSSSTQSHTVSVVRMTATQIYIIWGY